MVNPDRESMNDKFSNESIKKHYWWLRKSLGLYITDQPCIRPSHSDGAILTSDEKLAIYTLSLVPHEN